MVPVCNPLAAGEIGLSGAVSEKQLSLFPVLTLKVACRQCTRLSCLLEDIKHGVVVVGKQSGLDCSDGIVLHPNR